jgi:membrane protease subunit (stomatin/prohibitin family)
MSDGVSAFNCKVYFVNKVHKLEILWGTDAPIPLRDAEFGFLVGIRANGAYSIQIDQSKKFLIKMVGNNVQSFSKEELSKYFRTAFSMQIKTHLASYMKSMKMTVFDMATEYNEIARDLTPVLQEIMDEYGVRLVNFYLNGISVPEDDPNYQAINQAYQRKAELTIQGKDWGRISSKELLKDVANNPGSGSLASAGAGLGMGIAAGGAMGNLAKNMFDPMSNVEEHDFVECGTCKTKNRVGAKFCNECGEKLSPGERKCKKCGALIKESSKFCDECGEKVGDKDE